jgi:hypothetical protein
LPARVLPDRCRVASVQLAQELPAAGPSNSSLLGTGWLTRQRLEAKMRTLPRRHRAEFAQRGAYRARIPKNELGE